MCRQEAHRFVTRGGHGLGIDGVAKVLSKYIYDVIRQLERDH